MSIPPVLLKSDELFGEDRSEGLYDKSREISRYLLMHYGEPTDVFDRSSHPLAAAHGYPGRLSRMLEEAARATGTRVADMLDVGCNVGGVTHALSTWVADRVVGVDISPRSIEIARALTRGRGGSFSVAELGPFTRDIVLTLPEPAGRAAVEFEVGDAGALRGTDGGYDAVLLSNVLDRVDDPAACLAQFSGPAGILRGGGLLMIACPWSWYPEFSHPGVWLGSAHDRTSSAQALEQLMRDGYDLVAEQDQPGVLRQNPREYDYFEAHVTIWKKR
ncbi:class I SAM-dependent methyltransferase [Streptantibioticus silvisoli]|uniref:Methyltransferase domain-containing protein n=1 Tax=Streptantibioticus silvisoli TaxID=2705255 RepID=A0ABT6W9Y7_9ACTN|nr:class I SAM-dependent methyltransferase [Streptantibioticus silvisoli]MDI5967270.1 methyltransferase domain-containing protein [Streptantibioticus silvisoli]